MRIGWLMDRPGPIIGGAEVTAQRLIETRPEWAEIVLCEAGAVRPDCDAYVIHNCVTYRADDTIPALTGKPVVKQIHDYWPHGDARLRAWLLDHSRLVLFDSWPHQRTFTFGFPVNPHCAIKLVTAPIDVDVFRQAAARSTQREGVFWMAQLFEHKGVAQAVGWAEEHQTLVHFYGEGPLRPRESEYVQYCGQVPHADVPDLMATYATFLHVPTWVEPYGRTIIEAWAAGCSLIVNDNCGAFWWLQHDPIAVTRGDEMFWEYVEEAIR